MNIIAAPGVTDGDSDQSGDIGQLDWADQRRQGGAEGAQGAQGAGQVQSPRNWEHREEGRGGTVNAWTIGALFVI